MGKWVHRIVDGKCIECGPGTVKSYSFGANSNRRDRCQNSKIKSNHGNRPRDIRMRELGYPQPESCEACGDKHDILVTDHDHITGAARGYLCHSCNVALGFAKDDVDRLFALIKYLNLAAARSVV